jgi:cysteine protease ATG4
MDPHHCRRAISLKATEEYTHADFGTAHTSRIRQISFSSMDPSLVLAFYMRDRQEWEMWVREMEMDGGPCQHRVSPLFTLTDRPVEWGSDDRFSFDSLDS